MEYRRFGKNYVVRLDKGEEVIASVKKLCQKEGITLGTIAGLGATNKVTIGLFNPETKVYQQMDLSGPMEITALLGNISIMKGEVYLHCHINVCNAQMQVFGGHLNECFISATGELQITVLEGRVEREKDEEIGLNLYKFI